MNTTTFQLTDEQIKGIQFAVERIKAGELLTTLAGYAGTGKTTIIHEVLKQCGRDMAVCAYTGKAASVLRSKGLAGARTIHSLIYDLIEYEVPDPKDPEKTITKVEWGKIPREDLECDGFIIDEASMVGKELFDDLASYGLPILAVGDSGQLPPISKSDLNLMSDPQFTLEKIHRQAEGSGIISIATRIRTEPGFIEQAIARPGVIDEPSLDVQIVDLTDARNVTDADIFICGFNKTRANLNAMVRNRKKLTGLLNVGERIIALSNDRELGVFNGLMGTVQEILGVIEATVYPRGEDPLKLQFTEVMVLWDGQDAARKTRLTSYAFGGTKPDWNKCSAHFGRAVVADYGYAITCHKSQGSQWDRVVVINEGMPKLWDQARWAYTAVTRAAKHLTIGHRNV